MTGIASPVDGIGFLLGVLGAASAPAGTNGTAAATPRR
jgi:hypothetical protein